MEVQPDEHCRIIAQENRPIQWKIPQKKNGLEMLYTSVVALLPRDLAKKATTFVCARLAPLLNPFRTALPFWGTNYLELQLLCPKSTWN